MKENKPIANNCVNGLNVEQLPYKSVVNFVKRITVEEMKKNTMYKLVIEDVYIDEEGQKHEFTDFLFGYVRNDEDTFFFGSVYSYDDDGELTGGDTMSLSKEQFKECVKEIVEI